MVSFFPFLPEFQADKVEPETAPRLAVGATSPLWLMFGGAAAAGAAYWWWASRWREAVNLEAVMALSPEPVAPVVETEVAPEPVAPEPVVEAAPEPVPEPLPVAETLVEAAESAIEPVEVIAEVAVEPLAETVIEASQPAVEAMVEAEPAPVVEPEAVAAEATPVEAVGDDLTRLVGVGPKLAAALAELGVTRFSQIAAWSPDELASIDQLLNLKGRAERDAWVAQAKRFAASVEA